MIFNKKEYARQAFREDVYRVQSRLFLIKFFSQFIECPISLYENNEYCAKIISKDIKALKRINTLKRFTSKDLPLIDSDIISIQATKNVSSEVLDCFYVKLFSQSNIDDEGFFIQEHIHVFSKFSQDIKDEFPVLRQWLHFLDRKSKSLIRPQSNLTNRSKAIILYFTVLSREKELPSRKELKDKCGQNMATEFYSLYQPKSKNHRPLAIREIENIVPLLKDFPLALKLANVEIDKQK